MNYDEEFFYLSAILFNYFIKKSEEGGASKNKYDELIEKYNNAISDLETSGTKSHKTSKSKVE